MTRRHAGFTLLEVLIALGLMAVVVGLALGMLRLGARAWAAADARTQATEEFETGSRVLRRLIEGAFPMVWGTPGDFRYAFDGGAKTLSFVAIMPGYPGWPGPHWVGVEIAGTGEGEELRLVLRTFRAEEAATRDGAPIEDIVLVAGPLEASFTYWGRAEPDASAQWWPTWDHAETLPEAIGLMLAIAGGDRPDWPPLVIPVAITMDPACLFLDEVPTSKCRLDTVLN
jgi:general secretion pathway protein J